MKQIVQVVENKPAWLDYFQVMGEEEQKAVAAWRAETSAAPKEERDFLARVDEALLNVNEEYAISRVKPVWTLFGKRLGFGEGEEIREQLSAIEWATLAEEFAPAYKSSMTTRHQAILYYAYCIARGRLTIQQVTGSTRPRYLEDDENAKIPSGNVRYQAVQRAAKKAALNTRVVSDGDGFAILGGGGNRFTSAIGAMADVFPLKDYNQPLEGATCLITVRL